MFMQIEHLNPAVQVFLLDPRLSEQHARTRGNCCSPRCKLPGGPADHRTSGKRLSAQQNRIHALQRSLGKLNPAPGAADARDRKCFPRTSALVEHRTVVKRGARCRSAAICADTRRSIHPQVHQESFYCSCGLDHRLRSLHISLCTQLLTQGAQFTKADGFTIGTIIGRIGVVGTSLMASLSGFTAVYSPYNSLHAFHRQVTQQDIKKAQDRLSTSIDSVFNKKLSLLKSSSRNSGFVTTFMSYGSSGTLR